MARSVDHEHRDALVARAADHLLERGQISVTLTELAGVLGVSSRMLVHHFGSRDQLLARAIGAARARQLDAFADHLAPRPGIPYAEVLEETWRWFQTAEARRYLRLFGQLFAAANAPGSPHAEFARSSVGDWLDVLERGFAADGAPPARARELATLALAVTRGLLQDLNVLGDEARVGGAFERFLELIG